MRKREHFICSYIFFSFLVSFELDENGISVQEIFFRASDYFIRNSVNERMFPIIYGERGGKRSRRPHIMTAWRNGDRYNAIGAL